MAEFSPHFWGIFESQSIVLFCLFDGFYCPFSWNSLFDYTISFIVKKYTEKIYKQNYWNESDETEQKCVQNC